MRTLTPAQLEALSHGYAPDAVLTATRGSDPPVVVPVVGGDVTYSAASTERLDLRVSVPLVDNDGTVWAPLGWDDLLVPTDCVLDLSFGMGIGPRVHVAHAWLDSVRARRPDGTLELRATSRATRVSQAGLPAGDRRLSGPTAAVCHALVEQALGESVTLLDLGIGGPTVYPGTTFSGDPWAHVDELCDAAGGEAYFDLEDRLVLRRTPTGAGPAVATLATGKGGTVLAYDVELTRAPNVLRLEYQDPAGTADIVGTASATGAAAPSGPYGVYRGDVSRSGRPTQAQADAAARDYLTRAGGLLRNLSLEVVPNPGLEVGDTVAVVFVNGTQELHRVVEVDLPITPGRPMVVTTRATPW